MFPRVLRPFFGLVLAACLLVASPGCVPQSEYDRAFAFLDSLKAGLLSEIQSSRLSAVTMGERLPEHLGDIVEKEGAEAARRIEDEFFRQVEGLGEYGLARTKQEVLLLVAAIDAEREALKSAAESSSDAPPSDGAMLLSIAKRYCTSERPALRPVVVSAPKSIDASVDDVVFVSGVFDTAVEATVIGPDGERPLKAYTTTPRSISVDVRSVTAKDERVRLTAAGQPLCSIPVKGPGPTPTAGLDGAVLGGRRTQLRVAFVHEAFGPATELRVVGVVGVDEASFVHTTNGRDRDRGGIERVFDEPAGQVFGISALVTEQGHEVHPQPRFQLAAQSNGLVTYQLWHDGKLLAVARLNEIEE